MIDYGKIANWARLPARRQQFCLAYAGCGVGSDAALKAGYAAKSAAKTACLLLRDPVVRGVIEQIRKAQWDEEALSQSEAIAILSRKARGTLADLMTGGRIDGDKVQSHGGIVDNYSEENSYGDDVETHKKKVKLADSIGAIKLAAQLSGWLDKGKDEHDVGGVKVSIDLGSLKA